MGGSKSLQDFVIHSSEKLGASGVWLGHPESDWDGQLPCPAEFGYMDRNDPLEKGLAACISESLARRCQGRSLRKMGGEESEGSRKNGVRLGLTRAPIKSQEPGFYSLDLHHS